MGNNISKGIDRIYTTIPDYRKGDTKTSRKIVQRGWNFTISRWSPLGFVYIKIRGISIAPLSGNMFPI